MRSHILNDKRIIIINVYHNILFNRNPTLLFDCYFHLTPFFPLLSFSFLLLLFLFFTILSQDVS